MTTAEPLSPSQLKEAIDELYLQKPSGPEVIVQVNSLRRPNVKIGNGPVPMVETVDVTFTRAADRGHHTFEGTIVLMEFEYRIAQEVGLLSWFSNGLRDCEDVSILGERQMGTTVQVDIKATFRRPAG